MSLWCLLLQYPKEAIVVSPLGRHNCIFVDIYFLAYGSCRLYISSLMAHKFNCVYFWTIVLMWKWISIKLSFKWGNTSILGDFEFLAYDTCHHYEKMAKTHYSQMGIMGLFFGDSTQPMEPSDKVSACYYFFSGQTIQRLD